MCRQPQRSRRQDAQTPQADSVARAGSCVSSLRWIANVRLVAVSRPPAGCLPPRGLGRVGTVVRLQRASHAWSVAPPRASPSSSPHSRCMPASAGRSTACTGEEALVGVRPVRLPRLSALDIVQERHALHHPCASAARTRGVGRRSSNGSRYRNARSRSAARRARGDGAPRVFGRGSASGGDRV